ncbi:cryptochrome/photolyase family protein [Pseudohongiella sp.]|uniref:Photolyase/cryptochrome alpha/beta domain-containing protein n=1 Tax=marine sediment metagenome TaxID=412755 RepID=A0A0F9VP36_9ZZZZ|nr:deoxyribodipyrimidine photo-lyase [Pseudohongiella sp.]HDZ10069.1 deoxyribodipyrimidine photo-lyase [Pseudohongiella sp.]HEA63418.1 deoxyribodipyrimidine photo-lyase [Pseudohongiella sp.]
MGPIAYNTQLIRPPEDCVISSSRINIVWFRQDLRLADNPALYEACNNGAVIPVYILDDKHSGEWAMGGASRWWLHHSLSALSASLNGNLLILQGDPLTLIPRLVQTVQADDVYWNRCYEPWRIKRDSQLKKQLNDNGTVVYSSNGSLLWEPWRILKDDGTPYRVFTPFYRRGCLKAQPPGTPLSVPRQLKKTVVDATAKQGASWLKNCLGQAGIDKLGLLPSIPWDKTMAASWQIGEKAAWQRLQNFLDTGLQGYQEGRNFPARAKVSRLSPYLHFGEISPRQVWHEAQSAGTAGGLENDLDTFLSEIGWREFSYSLLYHNPDLPHNAIQKRFNNFPWQKNADRLRAWQQGNTGMPLVDAGMRELWQTGYMHNRVRMVVGSYLVKNLLLHWHDGEAWFWDCLVDADLSSNSASWQWIAGCGADASPYFRVFNPVLQSRKFDKEGDYLRKYVPELASLPDKHIHAPFDAPADVLRSAGVRLDENYPSPVVDLKASREAALAAFKSLS